MTPQDVWDYFGNSYQFMKQTGMSDSALRHWMAKGSIPEESQYKIERLTKDDPRGQLKRKELVMTKAQRNVYEAKQSLKSHIKLFQSCLKQLNGSDDKAKNKAMWLSWCLHRYINDNLFTDIKSAMISQNESNETEQK
jgi:DNA-binding transcriptional regulator Cro